MITNRTDLGRHLRSLVLQHYPTIRRACIDLDIDEREIRRAWARDDNVTVETLRKYYEKLGYEVHFTVEKRHDADRILHTNHPTQSMPLHNGRERERD